MKKTVSIFLSVFLVISMSIQGGIPTVAKEGNKAPVNSHSREKASKKVKDIVAKLISFYEEGYRVDFIKHMEDLEEVSPEWHEVWSDIFNYWDWIENDMVENVGVAPDGIGNSNNHAFIVLGLALEDDGSMTEELIGRLEVAKASADKYPESYIMVDGGVKKNSRTVEQKMHDWLVENGIAHERIIVKATDSHNEGKKSKDFHMLDNNYDVDSVSLITSQYHLKRASILYYTEALLKAKKLGVEPISFIGDANASWYSPDQPEETLALRAKSMRSIIGVRAVDISDLSTVIQGIEVSGKTEYLQGEELDIVVKSVDSMNYNLDLTEYAVITGFDPNKVGETTLHISYTQNDQVFETEFTINISEIPEVVDKTELENSIRQLEALDLSSYTEDSVAALNSSLEAARAVLNNPDAVQEEVDQAVTALNNAYAALKVKADENTISELRKFVQEVEQANMELYKKETADTIMNTYNKVKAALNNSNLTQDEAALLLQEVQAARNLLNNPDGEKVNENTLSDLRRFVQEVEQANMKLYKKETAQAIMNTYNKVKAALNNPNLTQDEADALLAEVQTARELLNNPDGEKEKRKKKHEKPDRPDRPGRPERHERHERPERPQGPGRNGNNNRRPGRR